MSQFNFQILFVFAFLAVLQVQGFLFPSFTSGYNNYYDCDYGYNNGYYGGYNQGYGYNGYYGK